MNAYWLIFSIPRDNLTKTQAETTGNIFGQCSRCICSCGVWQSQNVSAWQFMASQDASTCVAIYSLNHEECSVVAFMVQRAENSLLDLQGLRVDPHLPCPQRRTGLAGKCTLGSRLEGLVGKGHWQLGPDISTCFSVSFRDCIGTV